MRYVGQGFEIRVDLPLGTVGQEFPAVAVRSFEAAYKKIYGYADAGASVEAIDWYLIATVPGIGEQGSVSKQLQGETSALAAHTRKSRRAYFPEAGGFVDATVVDRYGLKRGERIAGPALIEERESMTVVLPGDSASISENGHLVIDVAGGTR